MPDLPDLANSRRQDSWECRENVDYAVRVNAAVDYVIHNLDRPLPLEDVARAAGFSPYHFHRIFRALMGETLGAFTTRVRLERAVSLLSHRARDARRSRASLTEIALACGFSSSSDFSRVFRARYGVPPSRFDAETVRRAGRDAMRATLSGADRPHRLERVPPPDASSGFPVTVRPLPARNVAYIRVLRPYEGDGVPQAVARLLAWAEARGLAGGQWLGYQWDDPEIVPLEQCRYDVGLEVPEAVRLEGEVGLTSFPACDVAEIEINGSVEDEVRALQWLFSVWLPRSGYAPAHQPMFEAWNGRPFAHGMEYFEFRIQLPLADARIPS